MSTLQNACLKSLLLCTALAQLSCGDGFGPSGRRFDVRQFALRVLANAPPASDFLSGPGVSDSILVDTVGGVIGVIQPYRGSNSGALTDGKFLARIRVNKEYRALKANVWNYWVVADTGRGVLMSVYVAADSTRQTVRPLSMVQPGHTHTAAQARWVFSSPGVPWATCTNQTCCCEDNTCRSGG